VSAHEPKLRALRALEAQQLTAAGETRLQRHVERCDVCARARVGLRLANRLMREVQASDPQLDFTRIEAAITRSIAGDRRQRALRVAIGVPLAAAAAAGVVWFATQHSAPEAVVEHHAAPAARSPEPESLQATPIFAASVTALGGPATLQRAQAAEEPLRVDSELREGDRVRLGSDSVAHLRFDRASGCVAGPDSELALLRLRNGETEVQLTRGRITSQVQPLTASQHYVIEASGYRVTVHGTRFEVAAGDDALDVMVSEGHVEVQDDTGHVIADLHARDHFAVDSAFGMRLATRDPSHPALQLELPRGLGAALETWPLVTLLDLAALESLGVTGLTVDGNRFPLSGQLALRVPRGDVTLIVDRLTGSPQKIVLSVPADGLSLAAEALRRLLRPKSEDVVGRRADPHADPHADIDYSPVLAVVHAGTSNLQRCYERALKQRPELDGRLTIRLAVRANGRVGQAAPHGQEATLPAELVSCLRNVAGQWRFPATGSALTFDVPLRLQHR
jgi:hypothetical protein